MPNVLMTLTNVFLIKLEYIISSKHLLHYPLSNKVSLFFMYAYHNNIDSHNVALGNLWQKQKETTMRYLMLLVMFLPVLCRSEDWQPVLGPTATGFYTKNEPSFSSLVANRYQADEQSLGGGAGGGQCDLYKVGFTQDLYFQYIQYKVDMPALKEFTLCFWSKFTNHSNDHPIFSYAGE